MKYFGNRDQNRAAGLDEQKITRTVSIPASFIPVGSDLVGETKPDIVLLLKRLHYLRCTPPLQPNGVEAPKQILITRIRPLVRTSKERIDDNLLHIRHRKPVRSLRHIAQDRFGEIRATVFAE